MTLMAYSFKIPLLNITAFMHSGYWDVWPIPSYKKYFYPFGTDMLGKPRIRAREVCFNALLAFGRSDGWICDDTHSWNCGLDELDSTFENWKSYGKNPKDRRIYEFDVMQFADVAPKNDKWPGF